MHCYRMGYAWVKEMKSNKFEHAAKVISRQHFPDKIIGRLMVYMGYHHWPLRGILLQTYLTLCMLGNISCFCCGRLIFLKINFKKKFIQEHYQSMKWFGFRSGPTLLLLCLGLTLLLMIIQSYHNSPSSYGPRREKTSLWGFQQSCFKPFSSATETC